MLKMLLNTLPLLIFIIYPFVVTADPEFNPSANVIPTTPFATMPIATSDPESFINDVSRIYRASMYHVFKNQALINQKGGDKSSLFGLAFIDNLKRAYKLQFKQPFPADNRRLHTILLRSMMEVMEENRTLINDEAIDYKGFIPAAFAFQMSELLQIQGLGLKIKFTNESESVRNKISLPDAWEIRAMDHIKQAKTSFYFDDQAMLNGIPAYRHFVPLKLQQFCLKCHGTPKDNPLNAHKKPSEWTNIDITGFKMDNWKLGDFGGGVSVTIYKKDFLALEELCDPNYFTTFVCHFYTLE